MLKSFIYFYEVKGNSKEKANGGIGIFHLYTKMLNNYYDLFLQHKIKQKM